MVVSRALTLILCTCVHSVLDQGYVLELMNLASLNPESRIVLSYPGEPERFFERTLVLPVGDGTCWVTIGGDGGLFDVTGQSDYPRSVVNLEQIMDAVVDRICTRGGSGGA